MLAALRHTLQRIPHRARLSTIATSEVLTPETLIGANQSALRHATAAATNGLEAVGELAPTAQPLASPLLLQMSALIRPVSHSEQPSDMLVELDPFIFSHPIRRDILHLCVVHHLDCIRQGSASTKTRGDVRGSGRKIRPQKGTGKARLSDGQSPMLRGGGVAFGPHPRDFSTKLPRKVIQMGMRVALSARLREQSLGVVSSLEWPSIKTRALAERLRELGWEKTLFVTGEQDVPQGLRLSSNNIPNVDAVTAEGLTVYDAVKWQRIVLDLAAVEWFEQTLGRRSVVE